MADDQRRIILERRAAFIGASLAALGGACAPASPPAPQPVAPTTDQAVGPTSDVREEADPTSAIEPPRAVAMPCLSVRVVPRVAFEPASAEPSAEGRATIAEVAQLLADDPRVRLALEGHRDAAEPSPLSGARAARVEEELVAVGVDPDRLCLADYGAERPLVPRDAPGRERNGRVDFRVLENGEACDDRGLTR